LEFRRFLAFLALMLLATSSFAQDEQSTEPIPQLSDAEASAGFSADLPVDTDTDATAPTPTTNVAVIGNKPVDDLRDRGRTMDLRSAIEESLRRNPFEQVRTNVNARIDIEKKDLFESFWLPNLTLDFRAQNHKYDRFYNSQNQADGAGSLVSPGGSIGVTVKDYTVFNWGRDYLNYLNDKNTLKREEQRLTESRRKLRFAVIAQYFALIRAKEFAKIRREQLRQASFIHRLTREKLQVRKTTAMEYYQTRGEFLKAQTEYQQALYDVGQENERLSNLLGDDYQSTYTTSEQLKFSTLDTASEDALRMALQTSPSMRDAKLEFENASRTYERVVKENMPLPKFTVGVGTYQDQFGPDGRSWGRSTPTGRNVEMVAAVNMSWTLIGEGGLFNSRENQRAYLDKRIAEIRFYNAKRELEVKLRTLIRTVRFLEQKVTVAEYQDKNARSNFDSTLDNYTAGRTSFPQIKLSLDNWVISKMNTENVKFDHLLRKIELADSVGIDDLPGDNFETLAVR
jgi:outer membrane protein TolC